jgi:hypothetical protein
MRWLAVIWCAGCGAAASDPGLHADLRVDGAQFALGAMPVGEDGPAVVGVQFASASLFPGAHDQPLLGALAASSTTAAIGLAGDAGFWIVGAGPPAVEAPSEPTFDARLSLARSARLGPRMLIVRAVDQTGRFGPPETLALTVVAAPAPTGRLTVHLEWDSDADLDLHVIDAAGVEIWAGHPSGYRTPPPPALPDPDAAKQAAQLDSDSNAGCHIDGRNQENVVWSVPPAAGHYVVRVDVPSLCGQTVADWRLRVLRDGTLIGEASGSLYDSDTRGAHGAGDGRTALVFDLS